MTFTVPDPAGLRAMTSVADSTMYPDAAVEPKWTAVAPGMFEPLIVTEVPPVVAPEVGVTSVTTGPFS